MEKFLKIAESFFKNRTWDIDGFIYSIYKIRIIPDYAEALKFYVNVELPSPDQSYIVPVFFEKIQKEVIEPFFKFLDKRFTISIEIEINHNEIFEDVYIKLETQRDIIEKLNTQISEIGLEIFDDDKLTFNTSFVPHNPFYNMEEDIISFNFDVKISNITLNNKIVKANPEKIENVAFFIRDLLHEREWLIERVDNIIFETINPETRIDTSEDIFIQGRYWVKNIDGVKVKSLERLSVTKADFIEVS